MQIGKKKELLEEKKNIKDLILMFLRTYWKKIILILLILIICIIVINMIVKGSSAKYVLDKIYDVYPDEVRELYQNVLDVSCNGDMNFDIKLGELPTDINKVNKELLAVYVISYLDKNDLFVDGMPYSQFVDAEKELLNTDSDLLSKVASFQYGDYRYVHMGDKIVRQENACVKGNYENLMHLYAFSYNEDYLSVYVNYGRIKDGKVYSANDIYLSEYNSETNLTDALIEASYYVFKFIKDGGKYKLHSIQHLSKA